MKYIIFITLFCILPQIYSATTTSTTKTVITVQNISLNTFTTGAIGQAIGNALSAENGIPSFIAKYGKPVCTITTVGNPNYINALQELISTALLSSDSQNNPIITTPDGWVFTFIYTVANANGPATIISAPKVAHDITFLLTTSHTAPIPALSYVSTQGFSTTPIDTALGTLSSLPSSSVGAFLKSLKKISGTVTYGPTANLAHIAALPLSAFAGIVIQMSDGTYLLTLNPVTSRGSAFNPTFIVVP